MQKVSYGRIVHIKGESRSYPAMVTGVAADGSTIDAALFVPRATHLTEFGANTMRRARFIQTTQILWSAEWVPQGDGVGEWSWPEQTTKRRAA